MNSPQKQQDAALSYIIMALIIVLLPLLSLATTIGNTYPVSAQGGQLYQPQSWDTVQGWTQNCQVAFPEGYRVPQRLVLTNNSLSSWSVPAIDLRYDFYNAAKDAIGIDYQVSGSFKTASSSTSSSTLQMQSYTWWQTPGNGTAYTPSVLNQVYPPNGPDCPPGDPANFHYSQVGPFTIPPNTYLIIYWEAHVAATLQWQLDPPGCYDPHNGACFFPGASLQTTIHNLGGVRSTQFPVACPEGSICGYKYLDTPPLGTYNAGDAGLDDWTICISGQMPDGTPLTVCDNTSVDGSYCFDYINDGSWTVSEQLQPGYVNTSPTSTVVVISDGTAWAHVDFFNQVAEPLLTIEKSWTDLNAGSVRPSDNICYTINYSNIGTAAANNVTITDDPDENWISSVYNISDNGTYVGGIITWLIGTLGVGDSGSVSYCVQLSDNTTFPAGETDVTNTVCIEPTDPNVCDNVTIEVRYLPALCLDKTWQDTNGGPAEPGDTICYTIGYCSPVHADNVTITDDPDETWVDSVFNISDGGNYASGIITWNIGTFGPGTDNVTYCVTLKGAGSFPAGTTDVNNTTCIEPTDPNLCDTETVVVEAFPSLNLEKVWQDVNGGQIVPSDNICYTITYSNNGNAIADNVTITDDPDETWVNSVFNISDGGNYDSGIITWDIGTLGVGENGSVSYCVTLEGIGIFPAGNTEVHNTACIIEPADPDICRTRSIVVQANPCFGVDKQADTNTAWPSDNITFTITVCNEGNAGGNAPITDNPDENYIASVNNISDSGNYDGDIITWDIGPLDPGECYQVSYSATLKGPNSFPPGTTPVQNMACTACPLNASGRCDVVTVEVENDIDLGITKRSADVNGGSVQPGDTITYTINYHNNGDTATDNVTIEDNPDENYINSISNISDGGTYDGDIITWHIGTIDAGDGNSVSYSAKLKSSSSFPRGTTEVTNTACIQPTSPVHCATRTLEVRNEAAFATYLGLRRPGVSPTASSPAPICVRFLHPIFCPIRAGINEPVAISTQVTNGCHEASTFTVTLMINGRAEQTKTLSVGPRATLPVNFTTTKRQPGTYTVDIGGQRGSFIITGAGSSPGSHVSGGLLFTAAVAVIAILVVLLIIVARRRLQGY
jgi:uncharacterized repeat protein (TIGR01451 family)